MVEIADLSSRLGRQSGSAAMAVLTACGGTHVSAEAGEAPG